ncbi:UNVERIFIED_CONTAM: hypothetical protein GTU68_015642 [Idotea baltica]|nr:hypothetical protein [Idotea baltica]
MNSRRTAKVAEVVREIASTTILFELRDPRIQNVTVTRTEVSSDLRHAKIYVSIMGDEKAQTLTMHGLRSSKGFIQSKIADRVKTRYTPLVTFILDEGIKKSLEASRILNEVLSKDKSDSESETAKEPTDENNEAAGDQDLTTDQSQPSE